MSDYLNYKDSFKKSLILKIVSGGITFISILLLIFCPCFKMNWADENLADIVSDTIPKKVYVEMYTTLKNDNLDTNISFSLKDELSVAIDNLKNETLKNKENYDEGATICGVFVLGLFSIVCSLSALISCVKPILQFLNLDNYALERYDLFKKNSAISVSQENVSSAMKIMRVIVVIILATTMLGIYWLVSFATANLAFSYFLGLSGITGWFVVALIILAVGTGVSCYADVCEKNIRLAIMKEEYESDKADK